MQIRNLACINVKYKVNGASAQTSDKMGSMHKAAIKSVSDKRYASDSSAT